MRVDRYTIKPGADLSGADLSKAYLSEANLSRAYLSGANLSRADLSKAYLSGADLSKAYLSEANLSRAYLSGADLFKADLSGANLSEANLSGANLSEANLSRAKGLLHPVQWLFNNFTKTEQGIIVYKAIGDTYYSCPNHWEIKENSDITEEVNYNRTNECGCGVNFATLNWINKEFVETTSDLDGSDYPIKIWKCLIPWEYAATICVPYNTDGKARCGFLKLLEKI